MSFHRFNPFTGRLKLATNFQPLYPLSPLPLQKSEPVIIYDSIKNKPLAVAPKSNYSTENGKPPTLHPKLWAKYQHYGAALKADIPVYIAGGKTDKILFGILVVWTGGCFIQSLVFICRECLNLF